MRVAPALLLALLLAGCVNWQSGYDNAAWNACMRNPDDGQRRACLDAAEANAREKRAPHRD